MSARWENWETGYVFRVLYVRTTLNIGRCWTHSFFSLDHGLDTVVHVLNEGCFGSAESPPVGNVVDVVVRLGVLAVSAADLHEEPVGNFLELLLVLAKVRQVDVNRRTQGRSEVRRAGCDVAEMVIVSEFCHARNRLCSVAQSLENGQNVCAWLHRNDAELVFLVDPDQERLVVVVENAATFGPVAVEAARLQEAVAFFEEEVVFDQLLAVGLGKLPEFVVLAFELSLEGVEGLLGVLLDLVALLAGDARSKREGLEVTSDSDSSAADHSCVLWAEGGTVKFRVVHVADVLVVGAMAMVSLDDFIKQGSKLSVALMRSRVCSDSRVCVLATRDYTSLERDTSLIFCIFELVPHISRKMFGKQAVRSRRKHWESSNILWLSDVGSTVTVSNCWSQCFFRLNHCFDTIVHILYERNLGPT